MNTQPVWRKQIDEKSCLLEYPKEPGSLNCIINYEDEFCYAFGSWGMERELITSDDCTVCCQAMRRHDIFKSISSFASNLDSQKEDQPEIVIVGEEKLPPPIKVSVSLRMAPLLLRKIRGLLLIRSIEFKELILSRLDSWAWRNDPEMPPEPEE